MCPKQRMSTNLRFFGLLIVRANQSTPSRRESAQGWGAFQMINMQITKKSIQTGQNFSTVAPASLLGPSKTLLTFQKLTELPQWLKIQTLFLGADPANRSRKVLHHVPGVEGQSQKVAQTRSRERFRGCSPDSTASLINLRGEPVSIFSSIRPQGPEKTAIKVSGTVPQLLLLLFIKTLQLEIVFSRRFLCVDVFKIRVSFNRSGHHFTRKKFQGRPPQVVLLFMSPCLACVIGFLY